MNVVPRIASAENEMMRDFQTFGITRLRLCSTPIDFLVRRQQKGKKIEASLSGSDLLLRDKKKRKLSFEQSTDHLGFIYLELMQVQSRQGGGQVEHP